jgi:hypothetical protein
MLWGAVAALTVSVGVASIAQADITGVGITVTGVKTKQDKKKHGPADSVLTNLYEEAAPTPIAQTGQTTVIDYDKDIKISPGKIAQCTPAQVAGKSTADARAACPRAVLGTGTARSCAATAGCNVAGGEHQLDVVLFNRTPEGGNPGVILYLKGIGTIAALPPFVVPGQFVKSPLPGYGQRLIFPDQPDVQSTGYHLRSVIISIPVLKNGVKKKVKGKKNPVTGKRKVKKVPQYFVMARCSDKQWEYRTQTSFRAGGGTHSATFTQACQQKGGKKKK